MAEKFRRVWITKDALTRRIFEAKVQLHQDGTATLVESQIRVENPDWWSTKEAALMRADTMRKHRIDDLRKELDLLERLRLSDGD
jgi:hypothetical protein